MSDLLKLCGLWRNERDGKVTLSGPLGPNVRLIVTKNQFKRNEKDPDYMVFLAQSDQKRKNQSQAQQPESQQRQQPAQRTDQQGGYAPPPPESEIPF